MAKLDMSENAIGRWAESNIHKMIVPLAGRAHRTPPARADAKHAGLLAPEQAGRCGHVATILKLVILRCGSSATTAFARVRATPACARSRSNRAGRPRSRRHRRHAAALAAALRVVVDTRGILLARARRGVGTARRPKRQGAQRVARLREKCLSSFLSCHEIDAEGDNFFASRSQLFLERSSGPPRCAPPFRSTVG